MKQKEITVTLGTAALSFDEADRIWGILYKLYHEQIDPMIILYEKALQTDIKAVGSAKLALTNTALNTKDKSVDLTPFAAELRHHIRDYREEHDYECPDMALYGIVEAFESVGEKILKKAFEDKKYGLAHINLRERMEKFELKYHESAWRDEYLGSQSLDEYIRENKWEDFSDINARMRAQYMENSILNVFSPVDDCFGNVDESYAGNHAKLIEEARKEIKWRQEYIANPKQSRLILEVRRLCEKTILDIISCTSQALEFGLNLRYCEWEEYQSCMHKILYMTNDAKTDCRKSSIEALDSFPFERSLYKYILREFGDPSGSVTALADFLSLDIAGFKSELLGEYVSGLTVANKNSEGELEKQLQAIKEKKQFLGCAGSVPRESEIQKRLQELDVIERTVKGKLYETREEAQKVKDDYQKLDCMIKDIDFDSYNLLEQSEIIRVKDRIFLSGVFQSDAFKQYESYVLDELEPVLQCHIQRQTWKNQIYKSREPWKTVKEIICSSNIVAEHKEKFKYWDFDGLKKYFPKLLECERPILFLKLSLLGWNDYFVLTNKRVLHIEKNMQRDVVLSRETMISYHNGQLLFGNQGKGDDLSIPLKYPENGSEYFLDIFKLIAATLPECNEDLFAMSDKRYRGADAQISTSKPPKGIFHNMLKGAHSSENAEKHDEILAPEETEAERLEREQREAEEVRVAKEKAEAERLVRERKAAEEKQKEEERIAKERAEAERLWQEQQDLQERTYNGVVYTSREEAVTAKADNEQIESLKRKLLSTKKQDERRKMIAEFGNPPVTPESRQRYGALKEKSETEKPKEILICKIYGITVLLTFIVFVVSGLINPEISETVFGIGAAIWAGFGVFIWPIWKIVLLVKSKNKNYYLNIKHI